MANGEVCEPLPVWRHDFGHIQDFRLQLDASTGNPGNIQQVFDE